MKVYNEINGNESRINTTCIFKSEDFSNFLVNYLQAARSTINNPSSSPKRDAKSKEKYIVM